MLLSSHSCLSFVMHFLFSSFQPLKEGASGNIKNRGFKISCSFKGVQGAMVPGPALMIARRGPTPKKKDGNCKEQGSRRFFWPRTPSPGVPKTTTV